MNPGKVRGTAIGILIGAMFGAFWAEIAASRMPSVLSRAYDVITVLMVGALCVGAVRLFRSARHARVPHDVEMTVQAHVGRRMWSLWMLVTLAEAVVIGWITTLLITHHLQEYVLAAVAVIVGLHFFPLTRVFRAPEHLMTAIVMTAVGCIAVAALAAGYDLGEPARWNIVIGTACAAALWGTCVRGLRQAGACGHYAPTGRAR